MSPSILTLFFCRNNILQFRLRLARIFPRTPKFDKEKLIIAILNAKKFRKTVLHVLQSYKGEHRSNPYFYLTY